MASQVTVLSGFHGLAEGRLGHSGLSCGVAEKGGMIGYEGFGAWRGGVENIEGARMVAPLCCRPGSGDEGERAERAFGAEPVKGVVQGIRIVRRQGVDKEGDRGYFGDDIHPGEMPGQFDRLGDPADRHHGLVRLAEECHVPGKAFKSL